ncbi:transglycosylase SLT domain-containing protein [Sphingopyxis macrogoltabida]|uniref:Transglycosylase SLT domain-containing protein n=1 Tax=Sphingopyxis macrogoltabida TaxID=33050 RepID=A0A0N9V3L2_SPHMC|nr:transglycosylase SLT domain-containing protein [Sphingopyxis macrogoltabida]ALH82902.1 hypothetical protein AN936_21855 [Sphingopyxis macrogoltabida]
MPRVQVYQANQVAPAETTGARHRAADIGAGGMAIGAGVTNLGRSAAEFADAQEDINLRFDDTEAQKAAQRYQVAAAKITSEFQMETGANAYGKRTATEEALAKLREETLGTATNDRMRRMASDRIAGLYGADTVKVGEHATRQLRTEQDATLKAQIVLSGEDAAANWDRPDLMTAHVDTMKSSVEKLGTLNGWSNDRVRLETSSAVSAVHKDVINRMLADDDIDTAQIYLEANADEMNATDELSVRGAMKEPLLTRQAQGDFDRAVGTMPVPEGAATKEAAPAGTSFDAMVAVTAQSESGNRERDASGRLITSPAGAQGKMQVMPGTNLDPGFGVRAAKDNSDAERTRVGRDYLAAMLKRYGGDPAKAWAAYNAGPGRVDDAIAGGGDWLSRLPKETRDYVKKNVAAVGGGAGAQQSARTWDKAAVYAQIDALADKEGWSPERRERSKLWADKEIARDEQLKAREEDAAEREASAWVMKNSGFTDLSQMPASIRDRLSPEAQLRYMEAAKRNAAPKEVPANGPTALALTLKSIYEPEGFKSEALGAYAGSMTRAELESLAVRQARMRTEKPKDTRMRSGITGAISWGEKYGGLGKFNEDQRVAIYGLMESDARRLSADGKKELTEQDYLALFKRATREVPTTTWYGGSSTRPIYDMGASNIPAATRKKIADAYRKTYGTDPTDEQVADYWRRVYAK